MDGGNVMISGVQSRMARAALDWSLPDIRKKTGLSVNTVGRFEQMSSARLDTMRRLVEAYVAAGVRFHSDKNGVFYDPSSANEPTA